MTSIVTLLARAPAPTHYLVVWQTVHYKSSARLPVLYLGQPGETNDTLERFELLIYFLLDHQGRSSTWMLSAVHALGLLYEFFVSVESENSFPCRTPRKLLGAFQRQLRYGSTTEDSGRAGQRALFWLPKSIERERDLRNGLRRYLQWLQDWPEEERSCIPATRSRSFAAFTELQLSINPDWLPRAAPRSTSQGWIPGPQDQTRQLSLPRKGGRPARFPEKYIVPLLSKGFVTAARGHAVEDHTAKAITSLLLFGGLRKSEPLHLWVDDVQFTEVGARLFLHHPADSMVRDAAGGVMSRRSLLWARYGLLPRCALHKDRSFAGWKGVRGDDKGSLVVWLPGEGIEELMHNLLWNYVMIERPRIMRIRRASGLPDHPYLFVSSGESVGAQGTKVGEPYALSAFDAAWRRALGRLYRIYRDGELRISREHGTTPHGARHFYGGCWGGAGVDGPHLSHLLRHRSPHAYRAYTQPTEDEINQLLNGINVIDSKVVL